MASSNVVGAQEDGESRQQQVGVHIKVLLLLSLEGYTNLLLREFLKVQEHRARLYSALHMYRSSLTQRGDNKFESWWNSPFGFRRENWIFGLSEDGVRGFLSAALWQDHHGFQ